MNVQCGLDAMGATEGASTRTASYADMKLGLPNLRIVSFCSLMSDTVARKACKAIKSSTVWEPARSYRVTVGAA